MPRGTNDTSSPHKREHETVFWCFVWGQLFVLAPVRVVNNALHCRRRGGQTRGGGVAAGQLAAAFPLYRPSQKKNPHKLQTTSLGRRLENTPPSFFFAPLWSRLVASLMLDMARCVRLFHSPRGLSVPHPPPRVFFSFFFVFAWGFALTSRSWVSRRVFSRRSAFFFILLAAGCLGISPPLAGRTRSSA